MWPWGSLDTPPRGLSHATPLGGCCVTVHDPAPAQAGGSCLPCQGVSATVPPCHHRLSSVAVRVLAQETCPWNGATWLAVALSLLDGRPPHIQLLRRILHGVPPHTGE